MRGNLLRVLDEMRFPARVAKDQERTETKWATKRERERKRERNEHTKLKQTNYGELRQRHKKRERRREDTTDGTHKT